MKLMGLFLFSFLAILSSLLIDTPREQPLSDEIFLEQEGSLSSSSTFFQYTGLHVVWAEVDVLRRKQRPYRNPLRRLRKKLRKDRRMRRRLLKGNPEKDSSVKADPLENEASQIEQQTENVVEVSEAEGAIPQRSKRGRKPTIETNHVFCPIEGCRGYLVLGPHPDHWIVGAGTYDTKSDNNHHMYRCKWCGERFSETRGTVFFGLKTPQETVYRALHSLCEDMGIRAAARVFEVKPDTILLWLRRAGEHCEKVSAYLMRNLHVEQAQLDELWTFVFKKNKTLSAWEKLHTEYGDTWVWTAIDPTHKLVLSLVVGEHEEEQAVNLLQKLKAVVVNGCLPLLVSDQLPHYVQAILKVFGRWVQPQRNGNRGRFPNPRLEPTEDLHYATVNKEYRNGKVNSVTTGVVFGSIKEVFNRLKALGMKKINTSFVERMNLTLRHMVSRLRRKGLTFSKKRQYLKWHLNLAVAYYHFVRPHRGLRRRLPEPIPTKGNGSPKKWDKRTPAMSAELTDHIWSFHELLAFRVPGIPSTNT